VKKEAPAEYLGRDFFPGCVILKTFPSMPDFKA